MARVRVQAGSLYFAIDNRRDYVSMTLPAVLLFKGKKVKV